MVLLMTALAPRTMRAQDGASPSLFSLSALLTVSPNLPPLARGVLVSEAELIWRREGVTLRWPPKSGDEPQNAPLRVLVVARPENVADGAARRWPVAELVPHAGDRAMAIASIAGAERVLVEATRHHILDNQTFLEFRLGVVLGRAVAHEIGHYLLATTTHSEHGLMRASIDAREFADPGARTFRLDEADGHRLRDRLTSISQSRN